MLQLIYLFFIRSLMVYVRTVVRGMFDLDSKIGFKFRFLLILGEFVDKIREGFSWLIRFSMGSTATAKQQQTSNNKVIWYRRHAVSA